MGTPRRLRGVDYAAPGLYFITVVTARRAPLLGTLSASGVSASWIGKCLIDAWKDVETFRPWVTTGAFTLMPDHWHGLLWWTAVPEGRVGSLPIVVNGIKANATRRARRVGALGIMEPLWMRSFDVRFIMSARRRATVERYIRENPKRAWAQRIASIPRPDGRG